MVIPVGCLHRLLPLFNMLDTLIEWDKALLLAINGWNSPFFDEVMFWISDRLVWIPFYVSLIYVLIRSKRFDAIYGLLAVALTVLLADQFASGFCKPFFERLRPTHDPTMQPFVHLVHGHISSVYGFCSSHASNTCGIAVLTSLIFRNKRYTYLVGSWALLNCYSRMYMGVHYPGDILCGALAGMFIGYLCYRLYLWCVTKELKMPSSSSVYLKGIDKQDVMVVLLVYFLTFAAIIGYACYCVCG